MITPNETASLLIQALPYIRRFTGKILVLKVGGLPMTDPDRARSLAKDVLLLHSVGIRPVLVHGGGPQIDDLMRKLGKSPEFRDGLRVTDGETLDLVRMVLVGKINRELVSALNALEPVAVGVAGEDGRLLEAAPVDPKLGFVGKVGAVRAGLLHALLDDGLVPIVSTVGSDANGQPYNINADDAARAIAVAMGAEKLVYLTGAAGLLEDPDDPSTLVHCLIASGGARADRCRGGQRRDDSQAHGLRRSGRGRGGQRAHDRRPRRACHPDRTVHRQRHRHDGPHARRRHDRDQAAAPATDRRLAARRPDRQPGRIGREARAGRNQRDADHRVARPRRAWRGQAARRGQHPLRPVRPHRPPAGGAIGSTGSLANG